MCAERSAVNTERRFINIVAILVSKVKASWLGKINLVSCDGKFSPNRAPGLDIDLWAIEGSFIWHFDKIDSGIFENVARHIFRSFPKFGFIDKLLPELRRIVGREPHQVFINPEELEVFQIHFVDRVELRFELLRCAVNVCIIHLHRAHPHQAE